MSPLRLICLLEIYSSPHGFRTPHTNKPESREHTRRLQQAGLIDRDPDHQPPDDNNYRHGWIVTNLGKLKLKDVLGMGDDL